MDKKSVKELVEHLESQIVICETNKKECELMNNTESMYYWDGKIAGLKMAIASIRIFAS